MVKGRGINSIAGRSEKWQRWVGGGGKGFGAWVVSFKVEKD